MLRKSGNKRHQPELWRRCRTLRCLKRIHSLMLSRGFLSQPSELRELIFSAAISIPGAMFYAYKLFDQIPQPDLFMWNTMIRGAAHTATPSRAISLYAHMERSGTRPDKLTFPFLLRACTSLASPSTGAQFHGKIVKCGLESDVFIRNALINLHANYGDLSVADTLFDERARKDIVAWSAMISGHARRGELDVAQQLFDESPTKDLVSWNVMVTAYVKKQVMDKARELFDRVPERDVVTWNTMISGYVQCGSHQQAMEIFKQMHQDGQRPDEVTMLSLLAACADSGALDVGQRIHCSLSELCSKRGLTVVLGNALIDMYAKCGSIKGALEVFRGMRDKDVSTWNSIIGGLACHGHAQESIHLFREMLMEKVSPDEITFVAVLAACSHGGMVDEGRQYFCLMQTEFKIEPNIKHYGCMVDMLGRAGLLKEAFRFVGEMKIKPTRVIWRTLLAACRKHGDVELGEYANKQLLEMSSDASGDYVLLSNIYASAGEWVGSENMRRLMDDNGVNKEAGRAVVGEDKEHMQLLLNTEQIMRHADGRSLEGYFEQLPE